ncbi:heat shock protein, Hsp20 family [Legionella gratiana]|uniref:Heat shock protein, Hsp20 family n=1 Tax=Legionella gratiana TaxID=45066 RepID=A0A378JH40_9GAMM|nr:Hsp20/alpha crystallin family protein [Legionella gratiana]KTD06685.1 heat shock protein, Hsp20 family [Legionella gratiana]STX46238.1 heat shock protein, Hsp20 family [Legionella gratiana]
MTRRTSNEESDQEFEEFRQQISRVLDFMTFSQSYSCPNIWRPPTDVYETNGAVIVKTEIAGVKLDEVNISFIDHVLTIQGTRIDTEAKLNYHCLEIPYGTFQVRILIQGLYDEDSITANYKNGYLYVILPKHYAP